MAHQAMGRALWNRRNKQEQGLLISHPRYSDILNNKRPSLVSAVQPAGLWPHLRKYNAVGEREQDKMTLNSTRSETVEKLLDHVERGPTWQLHSFLRSCNLTDQDHVIREVGLDPQMYDGPSPPQSDSEDAVDARVEDPKRPTQSTVDHSSGQHHSQPPKPHLQKEGHDTRGQTSTQILMEALTVHSEYYRDNFMTGRVFDFKHHEAGADFYDVDPCYIQQDVDVQKSKRVADQIKMRDVLRKFGQYSVPRTVLLVGPAGAGKSTFFRRFAFCWSKEMLRYLQDPGVHPCPDLLAVIYVPASSLTTDIWGSIERAVYCREDGKSLIIQQIQNGQLSLSLGLHSRDPKSAFLIDGIDEIRDTQVLKALCAFIREIHREGGPQILVSARTGLSRMENSIFNRCLHVEGYTLAQGLDYVQKYITQHSQAEPRENKDHHEHLVLSHLKRRTEKIMHILNNPLRAHILSGLIVEGLIELDDDNALQSVELLKTMENFFIKRETEGTGVPEEERNQFYKLCLYGLLEDIREFTEDHLQQFDVSSSAYVSFLRKDTKRDRSANQVTYYSFEHELMYEYCAARAIETLPGGMRNAILLYICSRDILRNLQKLVFGVLGEFGTEHSAPLLIGMTQLILLKQALNKGQKYPQGQAPQNVLEDIENLRRVSEDNGGQNSLSALFQSLGRSCCHQRSLPGMISTNEASGGGSEETDTDRWQASLANIHQLFQRIEDGIPAPGNLLLTRDAQDRLDIERTTAIWEMVDEVFVELAELVKGEQSPGSYGRDVYFSLSEDIDQAGVMKTVVLDLLAELTPQQQDEIAKHTYHKMIPCNEIYPCGGSMRWVEASRDRIRCWCPDDLTEAVKHGVTTDSVHLDFSTTPSQWGRAPDDHWTCAAWDRALQAVVSLYDIKNTLDIELHHKYSPPLKDLLSSIAHLNRSNYPGSGIEIWHGTISLWELQQWYQASDATHNKTLCLVWTTLQLPADEQTREQLLQWVGEEFLQAVEGHIADRSRIGREIKGDHTIIDGLSVRNPTVDLM